VELNDKTAVITGGASGIGRAMARRFVAAGANVVVGDIEEPAIVDTVAELEAAGGAALGVRCDVADAASVDALRDAAVERFASVDVVCLNAGVAAGGPMHELDLIDWRWTLDVNLYGVINGISTFLPAMHAANSGHLVITASVAGLLSYPWMGPYNASKHAVASIGETLHHELAGTGVNVSVLCPGLVNTNILDSDRNRPEQLRKPALAEDDGISELRDMAVAIYEDAMDPSVVADQVHDAIVAGQFWIVTDHVFDEAVAQRHREIEGRNKPVLRGHLLEEELRHR
jgi:NADP-dependent 3-hydroxy acid dehydrogenase YdfG